MSSLGRETNDLKDIHNMAKQIQITKSVHVHVIGCCHHGTHVTGKEVDKRMNLRLCGLTAILDKDALNDIREVIIGRQVLFSRWEISKTATSTPQNYS